MKKPVLLDGAVGTSLWAKADSKGIKREPVWTYNITHPEIVSQLVKEYIEAGSEIVLANTFSANPFMVGKKPGFDCREVIKTAVGIVKQATKGTNVKTALALGPLAQLLEPYGDLEEDECFETYDSMLRYAMEEKPDVVYVQTFIDLNMASIAVKAAKQYNIPVFCTLSFEKIGKTIMGNSVDDVVMEMEKLGVNGVGLNCSLGPDTAVPIIKEFASKTNIPIVFKPNAGLPISNPDGTVSPYSASKFAEEVSKAFEYVDYVGGCCGSDPSYIREINALIAQIR